MTITGLRKLVRSSRIAIHVDGEYRFAVDPSLVLEEQLFVGKTVSEEELASYQLSAQEAKLVHLSLALIARRPRTKVELERYLIARLNQEGMPQEQSYDLVKKIIERLTDKGYIDDRAFSKLYIDSLIKSKYYSPLQIKQKLLQKGIELELANELLSEKYKKVQVDNVIVDLIKKQSRRIKALSKDDKDYTLRLKKYLIKKGFRYSDIEKNL